MATAAQCRAISPFFQLVKVLAWNRTACRHPSRGYARHNAYGAPGFLRTRIKGKSDVKGGGGHGWVEASAGSGVGADGAAVGAGALAPGQRWSASRKLDVVLRLLRGESLDTVSREVGVELSRLAASASSDLFCTHPAVADPPAPNDKLRAAMTSIGGALIRDD